MKPSHV